jgi:hypothetical protein
LKRNYNTKDFIFNKITKNKNTNKIKEQRSYFVYFSFLFLIVSYFAFFLYIFFFKKKIENGKKKNSRPPNRQDRPGHRFFSVFSRFNADSLAKRFCTLTGLDAGLVPGSTGTTGRSDFDNLDAKFLYLDNLSCVPRTHPTSKHKFFYSL